MSTPTVTELHPPLQATDHDTFADDLEPRRNVMPADRGFVRIGESGRKRSIAGAS